MKDAIGNHDFGMEKSRDMGATWMFLVVFFHDWLFENSKCFGLVSQTQDMVDKTGDPSCLMAKLDFLLEHLPGWMRPNYTRTKLRLTNHDTESVIIGYAATDNIARGGRTTAFGLDECAFWPIDEGYKAWASTQHVTNCRIAVSTPNGKVGVFADNMHAVGAEMSKVSVHWSQHPDKAKGLYVSDKETQQLTIIDTDYKFPPDYKFVLDGKLRSPYYDRECRRHPVPALIAQELDIDYGGSGFPFFNSHDIDRHGSKWAYAPYQYGRITHDEQGDFHSYSPAEGGELALWINLVANGKPPANQDYVIGCDIATGLGGDRSTNSVASVFGLNSKEKVAEFCVNTLPPYDFAHSVIALAQWFSGPSNEPAYVAWEANGPGGMFAKEFLKHRRNRIYYREKLDKATDKRTEMPGWWSDNKSKRLLLGDYSKAIQYDEIVNRSLPALEEMLHYIHTESGAVIHDKSQATMDPTAAKENHGDRVIADALASLLIRKKGSYVDKNTGHQEVNAVAPYGSMAYRMQLWEDEQQHNELSSWM